MIYYRQPTTQLYNKFYRKEIRIGSVRCQRLVIWLDNKLIKIKGRIYQHEKSTKAIYRHLKNGKRRKGRKFTNTI